MAHWFLLHSVSAEVSQLTSVLGLTLHAYGRLLLSQNNVPLQKLPSSWPAQSLSWLQPQVLVPDTQLPPLHTSPLVQPLPSSQLAVLLLWLQPVLVLQPSLVHGLLSLQVVAGLMATPAQAPPPHASPLVQALPSSHAMVLAALTQPALGSQLSVVHTLLSLQFTAEPLHAPLAHTSLWLQALPSSQLRMLLLNKQLPLVLSHASLVHGLPSLHTCAGPALHTPLEHTSPTVHALPSLHGTALALKTQPALGSQLSSVHGLLSLQPSTLPAVQVPDLQASPLVHTLPSASQALVSFCGEYPHLPLPVVHTFLVQ